MTTPPSPESDQLLLANKPDEADEEDIDASRYMNDPEKRAAIERFSVDRAISFYKAEGFDVEEKGKPYDLLCSKGEFVVHVEVKGTTGDGKKVILTVNEVTDANNSSWQSDLFIVHSIKLDLVADKWVGSGGIHRHFETWCPAEPDLKATQFEYKVPTT